MFDSDTVKERLSQFGYTVTDADSSAITYCISKVSEKIRNETNQNIVPDGLHVISTDIACGEFLQAKRTFMPSSLNLDLDMAIKQISVGDTSTTFDVSSSDDKKLVLFINYLLHCGDSEYPKYRRLSW